MASPTVVPLDTPDLVRSLHRDVYSHAFPSVELVPAERFLARHDDGGLRSLGVVEDGLVVAGITGEWFPGPRVLLVLYLAIAPGRRGGGVGGLLVTSALDRWRALDPQLVVAEVEHPDHHAGSEAHGDPSARLRFYARLGARAVAVPYFQPGDGPGGERVPALVLVALPVDAPPEHADPPATVPGGPLRVFLAENLSDGEGTLARDGAARRLLDAADHDLVPLVDPADVPAMSALPVGLLDDDERYAPPA
ncbi:GNAT family N-acetyltransferase [Cellulosimicrobium terreum]|nr:GNAT family N-acetyltransferase [Cellulosimicrobium terreum]